MYQFFLQYKIKVGSLISLTKLWKICSDAHIIFALVIILTTKDVEHKLTFKLTIHAYTVQICSWPIAKKNYHKQADQKHTYKSWVIPKDQVGTSVKKYNYGEVRMPKSTGTSGLVTIIEQALVNLVVGLIAYKVHTMTLCIHLSPSCIHWQGFIHRGTGGKSPPGPPRSAL